MKSLKRFKIYLAGSRQRWNDARLTKATAFWIVLGAVILTVYVGFARAGWVTNSTATQMAATSSIDAVVERLAPICVAQVNQDPLKEQKLEELKEIVYTSRRASYVKDQGWAIMPGETTSDNNVVAECARQLKLLDE